MRATSTCCMVRELSRTSFSVAVRLAENSPAYSSGMISTTLASPFRTAASGSGGAGSTTISCCSRNRTRFGAFSGLETGSVMGFSI